MPRVICTIALVCLSGCGRQTVELFDGCVCDDASVIDTRARDPERCGAEERHCEDDEYCIDGVCTCRPPLIVLGEDCVDPESDGGHCGAAAIDCPQFCVGGECASTCAATVCEDGCVDTRTHPLHCGECERPCGANQICLNGSCEEFRPAPCAACPCDACGAAACEVYPLRPSDPICIESS
jgi:hypothetical protein